MMANLETMCPAKFLLSGTQTDRGCPHMPHGIARFWRVELVYGAPARHCGNRLFEWVMALALVATGALLILFPPPPGALAFRLMMVWFSAFALGTFCLAAGVLRFVALYQQYAWPQAAPHLRAFGAASGTLVWSQTAVSFVLSGMATRAGMALYVCLVLGELLAIYRAAADVRYAPRSHW